MSEVFCKPHGEMHCHVCQIDRLEARIAELEQRHDVTDERELLQKIRDDLLMRAETDSQGVKVVNLSGGLWRKLCAALTEPTEGEK